MKSSPWRTYRGHLIVEGRGLLGRKRFQVWSGRTLLGTFGSVVAAELHIDGHLARQAGA